MPRHYRHLGQQQQNYMEKEVANPETADSLIPYALYSDHKQARLEAQNQRQHAQHTIAYLQRQAKKALREAERRKQSLRNYYTIVQSRVEDFRDKEQRQKNAAKQLNQLKSANLSLKLEAAAKRASARSKLEDINKQIASDVKTFRSLSERKIQEERELERSLLKKKNEAITSKIVEANANSRVRAMGSIRAASNEVKGELIRLQQSMKQREIDRLAELTQRQKELVQLVERGRKEREKYEASLTEVKTLPIDQAYSRIKERAASKRSHRHSPSDSLIHT